ncbi:unnamed protein product [Psylliodes chrysocephalus]|uniref:Uncharacterized protein n=1 Tax=Psylliodes chrysocephalus TaxID=3402493 RepID=A0A9P0GH56_9CUCU|nr:unnamed protein product [Psylliodes chrysocephala]
MPDVTKENFYNRWRVVERNYKKYIDNQNSTARGRKYFEYVEEMKNIFGGKRSVHPEIILSNEQIEQLNPKQINNLENGNSTANTSGKSDSKGSISVATKTRHPTRKRESNLELVRDDRKQYYSEKPIIGREKLVELQRKNYLIKGRNTILKENNCKCCSDHSKISVFEFIFLFITHFVKRI